MVKKKKEAEHVIRKFDPVLELLLGAAIETACIVIKKQVESGHISCALATAKELVDLLNGIEQGFTEEKKTAKKK